MSHLSLPRIHFRGNIFINVGTGNNDDTLISPAVDGDKVKVLLQSGMTDDSFRKDMEQFPHYVRGGWNYYGDNDCYFSRATVTSVQLEYGKPITHPEDDPVIGAGVFLNDAIMVDLNSQGFNGVQIFADEFMIRGKNLLCRGQPTPSYSRWTSYYRNSGFPQSPAIGGTIFQASIPNDKVFDFEVGSSEALAKLKRASRDANGLTVRMCVHCVRIQLSDEDMAAKFHEGKKWENPAIGFVTGTIGPWHKGELASVTLDRLLLYRDDKGNSFNYPDPPRIDLRLGSAIASVNKINRVVSLDLVNAFPEDDILLNKHDCGNVTLYVNEGEVSHAVGPVPYDKATYEATSGVVDIPYNSDVEAALDAGLLSLKSDKIDGPLLLETPHMIDSDHRCVYMHKGESRGFTLHARHLGAAQGQPMDAEITCVTEAHPIIFYAERAGYKIKLDDVVKLLGPPKLSITPGKPVTFLLEAQKPGSAMIYCRPVGEHGEQPDPGADFFINVRVLPNENYDHIPDEELTFAFIYQEVLQYYHLMHPGMSKVYDLSDTENWTPKRVEMLLERLRPELKDRYGYMPRTRDLSDGKRRLLERWCHAVIKKNGSK
jgi:hypothetical protein